VEDQSLSALRKTIGTQKKESHELEWLALVLEKKKGFCVCKQHSMASECPYDFTLC
jgi:hypothetical protein